MTTRAQDRMTAAEYRQMMGLGLDQQTPSVPAGVVSGPRSGSMNKTEFRYSQQLDALKACGGIRTWFYEPIKLRLAAKTWYTPDFGVVLADGRQEFHEVKGATKDGHPRWTDDGRVKLKVAAELYPQFRFVVTWLYRDCWQTEVFNG